VCSAATNRKTLIKTSLRRGFLFSEQPGKMPVDLLAMNVIIAIMATDAAGMQYAFNLDEIYFGCGNPLSAA
jgi:hypothetical protein